MKFKNYKNYIWLFFLWTCLCCKTIKEEKAVTSVATNIQGVSWEQVGPSVPNEDLLEKYAPYTERYWFGEGQVSAIWIDPKDDAHILIGVAFGGLFETFDAGENWKPLTDKVPVYQIQKIEVKDGVIYISTGYRFKNPIRFSTVRREFYGLGVVKSLDGGKTWYVPETGFYCADFSLSRKHNTIYAVSTDKVYKSTDSGNSFALVADLTKKDNTKINDKIEFQNVVVHPTNPDIVFVAGRMATHADGKVFYKTTDGGKTWTNAIDVLEGFIEEKPKNSVGHYIKDAALFYNEETQKLWVHYSVAFEFSYSNNDRKYIKSHSHIISSTDFQNFDFEMQQEIMGGTHYSPKLYEKDDTLYLLAWYLQIKKPDSDRFINVGSSKVHQDCRAVGIDSKGQIYYGNDAGIVKSTDQGKTWTNAYYHLNANLVNEMSYYSDEKVRRLDIGTQDDGYYRNHMDGTPRFPIETHEGGIYTSPHNKDRIYVKDNSVKVSTDGGKKFQVLKLNNDKPVKIQHRDGLLIEDPIDSTRLYVGHKGLVYVSDELGKKGTWKDITPKNNQWGRGIDMAIPRSNNDIIYFANRQVTFPVKNGGYNTFKTQGHLLRSDDRGTTWKKISGEFDTLLTNAVISDVEVDHEDTDRVWFTLRNLTEGQKVFYSENGGRSWTNISYNLPNVPVNRIAYNQRSKRLLLANDHGVYYLEDTSWKDYGVNLPKVIITSMVLDHTYNEILVSTFGRGVWKAKLF